MESRLAGLLMRTAESPGADARAFYVTALALSRVGDRRWIAWIEKCLAAPLPDAIAEQRTSIRAVSEAGRMAERAGKTALVMSASARYMDLVHLWPIRDTMLFGDESLNPVALAARHLIDDDKPADVFALLQKAGPVLTSLMPKMLETLRGRASSRVFADAATRAGAEPAALASFISRVYGDADLSLEILERGLAKGDFEYRIRFAFQLAKGGKLDRALELTREILGKDRRESVALLAARLCLLKGDAAGSRAVLLGLAGSESMRPAHVAEMLDAAGLEEAALAQYRKAENRGDAPNIHLGRLLQRMGRLAEALVCYERDIKSGSRVPPWPEDEDLGPLPVPAGAPANSTEGRAEVIRLLKR